MKKVLRSRPSIQPHRVVVTGIGAVCSLGHEIEGIWKSILASQCGISKLTNPELLAATGNSVTVGSLVNEGVWDHFKTIPKQNISKFCSYAMMASDQAIANAGFHSKVVNPITNNAKELDYSRVGTAIASGMGSLGDTVEQAKNLSNSPRKVSPYFVPKILPNMAAGQVSIRHGYQGPVHSVSTACAAGCHAIGDATNFIRLGYADVMLAGGSEATIDPLSFCGFNRMKALSTNGDPTKASRPFDSQRDGFVMGEGACVFVLEELNHAIERGNSCFTELLKTFLTLCVPSIRCQYNM
jgi:3-oxoacyl-[acyl-carrier-protein] synthase II